MALYPHISVEDLVAEKFGIIQFCINCQKKISITYSEADFPMAYSSDRNLWIHDETQLRRCYDGKLLYAFPRVESRLDGIEGDRL